MHSIRHLICGIDGSDPARRAAAITVRLADRLGDRLVLVHVTPARPPMLAASLPVGAHPVGIADSHDLNRIEAEDAFASVEPDVAPASADRVIEHGDAATRLSAVASEKDARLIVVGTRGRGIATSAGNSERGSSGRPCIGPFWPRAATHPPHRLAYSTRRPHRARRGRVPEAPGLNGV